MEFMAAILFFGNFQGQGFIFQFGNRLLWIQYLQSTIKTSLGEKKKILHKIQILPDFLGGYFVFLKFEGQGHIFQLSNSFFGFSINKYP